MVTVDVFTILTSVNANVPCRFYLQCHVVLKFPRDLRHDGINGSGGIYIEIFYQIFLLFSLVKGETSVKVLFSFRYTQ